MDELTRFSKDFLALSENVLFCYNHANNRFRLFWIHADREVNIADMDFDEWFDSVLSAEQIAVQDFSVFKLFCNSVKNCQGRETYTFHSNLLSSDEHMETCRLTFMPRQYGDEAYVLGEWLIINELTGNTVENYAEGRYLDELTGLFNKKSIIEYAKKRVENTEYEQAALILMDLDDFSRMNELYGHSFGESVLKAVANVICSVIDTNGVEGRIGGDEFMIVLNDAVDELRIRNYLRTIKTTVGQLFQEKLGGDSLTCSMGVVRSRVNSDNFEELYRLAEKVLYIAKQKGKNRYIIYKPEMHGQILTPGAHDSENAKTYSDQDLSRTAALLERVVIDGIELLPRLLEQLARTLTVDRIMVFWGEDYKMIGVSNPELHGSEVYPAILDNDSYLDRFSDDMLLIGNIDTLEESMPDMHQFLRDLGIYSTMQHLLRDQEGDIGGIIVADECQTNRSFPQIAVQTFSMVCKVINGLLLKKEAK